MLHKYIEDQTHLYPHQILLSETICEDYDNIFVWMEENIGQREIDWIYFSNFSSYQYLIKLNKPYYVCFAFKTKKDATLFKMRWL